VKGAISQFANRKRLKMKKDRGARANFKKLRVRAEKSLHARVEDIGISPIADINELINELHVHQVELEMQNEELRKAQLELEESHNKYQDLFDFAPVGYFAIDDQGLIRKVNLAGAGLLGTERGNLIKMKISSFISPDFQDVFYFHRKRVAETKTKQFCELKFVKENGTPFYARLETIVVQDSEGKFSQFRTALTDINERKQAEEVLLEKEKELENQAQHLEKMNTALKVLLAHRNEEMKKIEENMLANVGKLIMPYIEKMEGRQIDASNGACLSIIKSNLLDLVSPFANRLSSKLLNLTRKEIQIADLIKKEKTSKEIGTLMNLSLHAISFHRNNIRKKLGLVNKDINLISYLQSLPKSD
jgi:PAS domain S-box-containing protein